MSPWSRFVRLLIAMGVVLGLSVSAHADSPAAVGPLQPVKDLAPILKKDSAIPAFFAAHSDEYGTIVGFKNYIFRVPVMEGACQNMIKSGHDNVSSEAQAVRESVRSNLSASQHHIAGQLETVNLDKGSYDLGVAAACGLNGTNCSNESQKEQKTENVEMDALKQKESQLKAKLAAMQKSPSQDPQLIQQLKQKIQTYEDALNAHNQILEQVKDIDSNICSRLKDIGQQYQEQSGLDGINAKQAQSVVAKTQSALAKTDDKPSWFERNKTLLEVGAGAAVAGGALGYVAGSSGSSDQGSSAAPAQAASTTPAVSPQSEDGTCIDPSNVSYPSCVGYYISVCSQNGNMKGCSQFTTAYCGASGSSSAPGNASAYCTLSSSRSYCRSASGASSAPACAWLQQRSQNQYCLGNPANAGCLPNLSRQQFADLCKQSPGDPLCGSSLAQYVHPSNTASATSLAATGSRSLTGTTQIIGTSSSSKASGSRKLSSLSLSQDVSSRFGESLLTKSNSAIQGVCNAGLLADCGAQKGIN